MGQIFFVNPFAKTQVTGGIKTFTTTPSSLERELGFNTLQASTGNHPKHSA
jgi:hypothetical protein